MRECPRKEKLNAILVRDNEQEETIMHINSICVLNCLIDELQDLVMESSFVKTYLGRLYVLQQGKSSVVDTLMYV